jgi:protein-arginine kinase activator protein McsA
MDVQHRVQLDAMVAKYGAATVIAAIARKTCSNCGHTWTPRITTEPKECPRCKSRKWNVVARTVTMRTMQVRHHGWIYDTYNGAPTSLKQIAAELQVNGYLVVPVQDGLDVFHGAECIAIIK